MFEIFDIFRLKLCVIFQNAHYEYHNTVEVTVGNIGIRPKTGKSRKREWQGSQEPGIFNVCVHELKNDTNHKENAFVVFNMLKNCDNLSK